MKLWLDDVRKPPDDSWTWAKTCDEAIEYVTAWCKVGTKVEVMSLDHDLGAHDVGLDLPDDLRYHLRGTVERTGYTFVQWLVESYAMLHNSLLQCRYVIHSWNPDGAKRMLDELTNAGCLASCDPYTLSR